MNIVVLCRWLTFLFFLSSVYEVYAGNIVNDNNNFGPFDVPMMRSEVRVCKGLKKDVARVSAIIQLENNNWIGHFNITYFEETRFYQMKMAVYSVKNNVKTLLYTYKLHDPCKHFLFGSFIQEMHNTTSCTIKKGSYSSNFNMTEIMRSLLGSSFFFGEYMFKTNISAKDGNICCFISFISFTRKEESVKNKN